MADIIENLIQLRQSQTHNDIKTVIRGAINEIYKLRGQMKDAKVLFNAGMKTLGTGSWESNKDEEPELPLAVERPPSQPRSPVRAFVPPTKSLDDEPF